MQWCTYARILYQISICAPLQLLQPWQAQILGGQTDYFWDSVWSRNMRKYGKLLAGVYGVGSIHEKTEVESLLTQFFNSINKLVLVRYQGPDVICLCFYTKMIIFHGLT